MKICLTRSVMQSGPRHPLPKTKNSSDLAHYFWARANSFLLYFYDILFYFSIQEGMAHLPPPPRPLTGTNPSIAPDVPTDPLCQNFSATAFAPKSVWKVPIHYAGCLPTLMHQNLLRTEIFCLIFLASWTIFQPYNIAFCVPTFLIFPPYWLV